MNHKLEQNETEIDDLLEEYDFSKAKPGRHRGFKGALVRVFEDGTEQVIELSPRNNTINLSPEAIRLIIEALEYRIEAYQRRLEEGSLDESESEVINNLVVLAALSQELKKSLEMPALSSLRKDPIRSERGVWG